MGDRCPVCGTVDKKGVLQLHELTRPVVGWEDFYIVTSDGRVISLRSGRPLKPRIDRAGRPGVSLSRDGSHSNILVAKIVAEAFLGPRPDGMFILHEDDDPTNNRADNLYYGTPGESQRKWRAKRTDAA